MVWVELRRVAGTSSFKAPNLALALSGDPGSTSKFQLGERFEFVHRSVGTRPAILLVGNASYVEI